MTEKMKNYSAYLSWFNKQFAIRAQAITYIIVIPVVFLVFRFNLELSSNQKEHFSGIIIGVVIFSLIIARVLHPLYLKKFKLYLSRKDNNEPISQNEEKKMHSVFARIPITLAIDCGLRWGLGLFSCAAFLRYFGPLSITSMVIFSLIGISSALLGFVIYYFVSSFLLRKIAPFTVYDKTTTDTFVLTNRLSRTLVILIIAILLLLSSLITTIVYVLTYNSMKSIYQNQMANINSTVLDIITSSYDEIKRDAELFASNEETINACSKNKYDAVSITMQSMVNITSQYDSIFIASTDGTITHSSDPEQKGLYLPSIKDFSVLFTTASTGESAFSPITKNLSNQKIVVSFMTPVNKNGRIISVVGFNVYTSVLFNDKIKKVVIGKHGYPFAIDSNFKIIGHPEPSNVGEDPAAIRMGPPIANYQ